LVRLACRPLELFQRCGGGRIAGGCELWPDGVHRDGRLRLQRHRLGADRQLVAETAEEVEALGVSAGMDVEAPSPYGYGQALVRAVESGLLSEFFRANVMRT
jgi:hypothetical protein